MASRRGPLVYIVLAATGQDVRRCRQCDCCILDDDLVARMDLLPSEVMQAVRQDDERALTNRTIWVCADADPDGMICPEGLDLHAIMAVLREEARRRGLAPGGP
ncbi:MAG TPA: hypothetical protein ENK56_07390 [Chloroflexi bacterium]|nr:hypothetical protein [Chloroflexota bacterium]